MLTDAAGFPPTLQALEGNKVETAAMLPVITAFITTHRLADVVMVADAGMISAANQARIQDAGLSFILGYRMPDVAYVVAQWRPEHSDKKILSRCSQIVALPRRVEPSARLAKMQVTPHEGVFGTHKVGGMVPVATTRYSKKP